MFRGILSGNKDQVYVIVIVIAGCGKMQIFEYFKLDIRIIVLMVIFSIRPSIKFLFEYF